MKSYPVTIVDDFFIDPDYVRDLALSSKYIESDPRWPGRRTDYLKSIDETLFHYVGNKLFNIFSTSSPDYWNIKMHFQKIYPFSEDKWDRRNRGWVHYDSNELFGGIIYLTKNPDPDTGTSIYKTKNGLYNYTNQQHSMKIKLYNGDDLDIDEYNKHYDEFHIFTRPGHHTGIAFTSGMQYKASIWDKDEVQHMVVSDRKNIAECEDKKGK